MSASSEPKLAAGESVGERVVDSARGYWTEAVNQRLVELLPVGDEVCPRLAAAMAYSLLAPGKRVRPLLAIHAALHFDADPTPLIDFGCALEMVHCASLMLDDLPCMDNASSRRGQPASHHQHGEATTTLAAIALLNLAFGVISRAQGLDAEVRCVLVDRLSLAVGTAGLVSGQSRDLGERTGTLDSEQLARINHQKTGVLFELAVVGSGLVLGLRHSELDALASYAKHLGQAFQAADDLLDSARFANGSGKDSELDRAKAGSVHRVGEEAMRQRVRDELELGNSVIPPARSETRLDAYAGNLFRRFI